MKNIHFFYGNQHLEIEEAVKELVLELLPEDCRQEAFFSFDISDFVSRDQAQGNRLLSEFKSTCETVSFFSPVIVVYLKNLQKLPSAKSQKPALSKELAGISLVKIEDGETAIWVDLDTLPAPPQTRNKLSGEQIVVKTAKIGDKSFAVEVAENWKDRTIYQLQGEEYVPMPIGEFLSSKLKKQISVGIEGGEVSAQQKESGVHQLLYEYFENPPEGVRFIVSAEIRNTREIDSKLYSLIKKNGNEIKKTIAYDDFRPVSWVMERSRKKGVALDKVVADLLIEICGSDFSNLDMELEKLSMLKCDSASVAPEDLMRSVSQSKSYTVFRINDFLIKKDLRNALECLKTLLHGQSIEHANLFAIISAHFRKVLKISWLSGQGLPEKSIIDQMKLNPWIGKQLIKNTENFTSKELENLVVHLAKRDLQVKYANKESATLLENICYQICRGEFRQVETIESHWLPT